MKLMQIWLGQQRFELALTDKPQITLLGVANLTYIKMLF